LINGKVYIGQAADVSKRWSDHRRKVESNKPQQVIHRAMIKYGLDNFSFEVIANCKTLDDANEIETALVKQYDSFIRNGKGYNATLGGMNAPKSDEWRAHMSAISGPKAKAWMDAETVEHRAARYKKVSNAKRGRPRVPGSGRKKGSTQISHNRKLTKEQVEMLISEHKNGISIHQLSRIHKINRKTISNIVRGKTYKQF
jgi:group I intron endonuclease